MARNKYKYFATPGSGDEPDVIASWSSKYTNTSIPPHSLPAELDYPARVVGLRLFANKGALNLEAPVVISSSQDLRNTLRRIVPQIRRSSLSIHHDGRIHRDVTNFPMIQMHLWGGKGFWRIDRPSSLSCELTLPSAHLDDRDPYALSVEQQDGEWIDRNSDCLWEVAQHMIRRIIAMEHFFGDVGRWYEDS